MKTMLVNAGGVYADYTMEGKEIRVGRVYRGAYTFTDPLMVDHAVWTIRAVLDGWLKISESKAPRKRG